MWAKGESLNKSCCGLASTYLESYLKEEGFNVEMISSKIHIYLKVAGLIVDPTIRQFFFEEAKVPTIFVGDEKDLEEAYLDKKWFPGSMQDIYRPETEQEDFLRKVRGHYL